MLTGVLHGRTSIRILRIEGDRVLVQGPHLKGRHWLRPGMTAEIDFEFTVEPPAISMVPSGDPGLPPLPPFEPVEE